MSAALGRPKQAQPKGHEGAPRGPWGRALYSATWGPT
jgi:hypothetical protein